MHLVQVKESINDYAQKLGGIRGLKQRLAKISRIKNPNQLTELKNELEVAVDLVKLLGKENVEFLGEGHTKQADIKAFITGKSFLFEVTTIREDIEKKRAFVETLVSKGSAWIPEYYNHNKNKLWNIYEKKKEQLKGPFNILVIKTERFDFDTDTLMKFLFGRSFEGTTLEDAIDEVFEVNIDPMYDAFSQRPDFLFKHKEDLRKETIKINIKGLIYDLHIEGFFSHVERDLVAVAFNGIHEGTFFINPFSKLDFDIKRLFFPKTT